MTTRVFADLHLTPHEATSEMHAPGLRRLSALIREVDMAILAGDTADGWQCQAHEMREWFGRNVFAVDLFMALVAVEKRGGLAIQAGNHDSAAFLRQALPPVLTPYIVDAPIVIERGTRSVWIEHGNSGDLWNHGGLAVVGRAVTAIGGGLERLGWRDVEQHWERLWGSRYSASNGGRARSAVERWAIRRAHDLRLAGLATDFVFGHTHRAGEIAPGVYNVGYSTDDRIEWVEVADDGSVEVRGA